MGSHEAPSDLLIFWQQKEAIWPKLSLIANSVLGVPAASTASERAFSRAGRTMEERRCQLSVDTVDGLLFIQGLFASP